MDFNITEDWLTARARVSPHHTAITEPDDTSITFSELKARVDEYAAQIEPHVEPGQHIALLPESTIASIVQLCAVVRLGGVLIPLNTRLTSKEIAQQLRLSDGQWVIPPENDELCDDVRLSGIPLLQPSDTSTLRPTQVKFDTPFAIVHTSGTSGTPKGAVLSYGNIFYSAMASAYRIGVLPHDRWLSVLPLYHVGGLSIILRSLLYGTTVDLLPRFDVDEVNRTLTERPITLVSLVPTMLYRLLEARTTAWNPKLRLVLLGGAAPSEDLVQRCIAENIPLATTYGLTEASSQVATATLEQVTQKPGSVGKPLMFNTVKIVDENNDEVPVGEYGEIIVSGPTVMGGYYNNSDATKKVLHDGYLHTGDIGYMDEDGDLWIVQRRTDLIVTGGENVYPAEVEAILRQHTAVKDVAVIGLPHAEWGHQVVAAIVTNTAVDDAEIMNYARQHLAGYKIPRIIKFVDELPQTASGKIQRSELGKLF